MSNFDIEADVRALEYFMNCNTKEDIRNALASATLGVFYNESNDDEITLKVMRRYVDAFNIVMKSKGFI